MTAKELYDFLERDFKVVSFVDLADINLRHSEIYRTFKKYHKFEYSPQERLVFYSKNRPSDALLFHIQEAANIIDISNFFILICCPYDISDRLRDLKEHDPIKSMIVDVDSKDLSPDRLLDTKTICPLPWMHLAILNSTNGGSAHACCVYKEKIGYVSDAKLNDLFYSDQMRDLREQFSHGQRPSGCSHCWRLEENNIVSNRQWVLDFYKQDLFSDWIDDPKIRSIDFRASNVCNFKCRICTPLSSSLIAKEKIAHSTAPDVRLNLENINNKAKWYDASPEFMEQMLDLLPDIINIDFYGGEPFLLKQLPRFLLKVIESNHADHIRLHFNTNGSIYPIEIIPYLTKFRQVDISISIDSIGKQFEFERGGSWKVIEENYLKFSSLPTGQFNVSVMPTVNIQNVLYLDSLFTWADQAGARIIVNYVDDPVFNIDNLTLDAKKLVIEKYQNHPNPELRSIAERVSNSPGSDGKEFIKKMQFLDQIREQNFLNSHKEIAIAMGYVA